MLGLRGRLSLAMLLGALPLAGAGAQALTGRITGAVRDVETGKPLPNAVVVVSKPGDRLALRQVRTDSTGSFAVDSLKPARYRLQASHPRLNAYTVRSLDFVVPVRRGSTTHALLGGPQPPRSNGEPSCSDGIETHPSGIEMTGLSRPVGGGAASVAVLRPGEQGTNTQYTLVDGCRKAPLSERAVPPQR